MANMPSTDVDPFTAVESLRAALDGAGIVLPSLAVDPASPALALVDLAPCPRGRRPAPGWRAPEGNCRMISSTHTIPADALMLLALPELDTLTDGQTRGAICVWGDERLTGETAVDLGEQAAPRWFPRACRRHTAERAHRALFDHAPGCDTCRAVQEPGEPLACEVGRTLWHLVKDGRR